jgi:hypothetical protein
MNNNLIYIFSFAISLFILYLIIIDLQKFKIKLYNEINKKIWIKVYALISIFIIHLIWIANVLLTNLQECEPPYFLIIPYIIYLITDIVRTKETIASKKINRYLNYLISVYSVIIIFIFFLIKYLKINSLKINP